MTEQTSIWFSEPNSTTVIIKCTRHYACLLQNGLNGAAEALRILVNEASRIERAQHLQAMPYERSAQRQDYANGYKPQTVLTRMGEVTFEV